LDYEYVINYFLRKTYFIRIFRGFFYIKTPREIKYGLGRSILEIIATTLNKMNLHWYFGLYSALKFNNATHEFFNINYIVSNSLYRSKIINISNNKFIFKRFKSDLFSFGIIENKEIKYSDLEKTILDLIYFWKYNNNSEEKIILNVSEYIDHLSLEKIEEYINHYPNSIKTIMKKIC